jgi:hypothetical protein
MIKCVSIYIGTMPVAVGQVRYSMVEVWYGRMVGPYFVFCIFKYVFCGVVVWEIGVQLSPAKPHY